MGTEGLLGGGDSPNRSMVEATQMTASPDLPPASAWPRVMQVLTRMNVGGITNQVLLLSEQLRKQGYDVHLVAGQPGAQEGDCRGQAVKRGFPVHRISCLSNDGGVISDAMTLFELYRLFSRERPVVVHLYMLKARLLGSLAARLAGVPVVIETLHGTVLEGYFGKLFTGIVLLAERIIGWWLVHLVIAPSESQRTVLRQYRIAPTMKMVVQRVGFDPVRFEHLEEFKGLLRKQLDVSPRKVLVGVLARLVPIKGVSDFLAAAALVSKTYSGEISFVVVGDGHLRSDLEQQANSLALSGICRLHGRVEDVRSFYADVDVVVLSSWNEGTPIGLLEAMAAGKAIVATRVGGMPDMVVHGVSAFLIPKCNPEELSTAILKLATDEDLRERFGREAKKRVCAFNIEALSQSTHSLYQDMLKSRGVGKRTDSIEVGRS